MSEEAREADRKKKKPSMSVWTSFMLSLKNLFTKKGRTTLTAFAGSIGIIGIALILAISQGMTTYINIVQENTLSAYPLTIEKTTVELSSLMESFMNISTEDNSHENDAIYQKAALYDIINALNSIEESENDLKSFREFLINQIADETTGLSQAVNGVQYSYNFDLLIYTENVDGEIIRSDTRMLLQSLMAEYMGTDVPSSMMQSSMASMSPMASMGGMSSGLWQELLPGTDGAPVNDLIYDQYDLVYGSWPNSYDEIVLVVDKNNELDDVTLYALGLLPEEDMGALIDAAMNGTILEKQELKWSYEDICAMEFRTILNADCYAYDELTGLYHDLRETDAGVKYLYDNALSLKVTGIIRPNEKSDTQMLSGDICYTYELTEYMIEKSENADVIKAQLADPEKDILTGLPFKTTTGSLTSGQKKEALQSYLSGLDQAGKAAAYISINCIPSEEFVQEQIEKTLSGMTREDMEKAIVQALSTQMNMGEDQISDYLSKMKDEELTEIFTEMMREQVKMQYAAKIAAQMRQMSAEQLVAALEMAMPTYTDDQWSLYYDEIMTFSESTYEANLQQMGYVELESPDMINIYASSFENKDIITAAIADYNRDVEELQKIKYTDYIGIMMSSITTIINAITYVLIAFVAISLVVSSIMIGVITLISVQERTKEIGILRAIGASKKDVSGMFNAETMIIGFASGLLGVVVTYLLCIPINAILHAVTGIANLNAILPVNAAIILVAISVGLTLISGIIPSRSAAKKDPVVALRTE